MDIDQGKTDPSSARRGDEAAEAPARDEHHDNGNGDTGGDSCPVDVSDDDDAPMMGHRASKEKRPGRECPFLDTVSR